MAFAPADSDTARIVLDQTACIRSQSNIGETITHNICTGATAVVPWGSADWLGFAALCGLGVIFAALLTFLGVVVAREMYW